jgi:hypothetical protein
MDSMIYTKDAVVLTLSNETAARVYDLLAAEAATEKWSEKLFNVMHGDGSAWTAPAAA